MSDVPFPSGSGFPTKQRQLRMWRTEMWVVGGSPQKGLFLGAASFSTWTGFKS